MNRLWPAVVAVVFFSAGCGGDRRPQPSGTHPVQPPATRGSSTLPVVPQPPIENRNSAATKLPPVKGQELTVAVVNGVTLSREQFITPLIEAHGLNVLLNLVQLELAKQQAFKLGVAATPADLRAERDLTLRTMFKDTNAKLADQLRDAEATHQQELADRLRDQLEKETQTMLEQFLQQQKASKTEFLLLMETNANLRKAIEKQLQGKISDENVRTAFNLTYGENVRVKHIQCSNLQEVAEAQRRLEAGETFEKVAESLSRNPLTKARGGELPPFSRETPGLPTGFKDVAFSLKEPGEVSEPVQADGAYHLIKLVEKMAPKAIKYDDVKDSVRQRLFDGLVQEQMKNARAELARVAMETLDVKDPILARQYKDRLAKREAEMRDRDQINRELERQRESNRPLPTTAPNRISAEAPADSPANTAAAPSAGVGAGPNAGEGAALVSPGAGVARPPATQSGSDTPDAK